MAHLQPILLCRKNELNKAIISPNKKNATNNKGPEMKKILTTLSITTVIIFSMTGCNKTQEGAGVGAAVGALAGLAIGGNSAGTLIGAGAGALVGGAIGNDQEN
jgi:hypothetical protein